MSSDIAVIGLAVMGENLVLNMANHGFKVSVYNRTTDKVKSFVETRGKEKSIVGCYSIEELVKSLSRPRKIMMMIMAGSPVDKLIAQLLPFLEEGDILIDGGNSLYTDSTRRMKELAEKKNSFRWIRSFWR